MCTTLTEDESGQDPPAARGLGVAGLVTLFSFASTLVQGLRFRACRAAHERRLSMAAAGGH